MGRSAERELVGRLAGPLNSTSMLPRTLEIGDHRDIQKGLCPIRVILLLYCVRAELRGLRTGATSE